MDKVLSAQVRFLPMAAYHGAGLAIALGLLGPSLVFGQVAAKAKPAAVAAPEAKKEAAKPAAPAAADTKASTEDSTKRDAADEPEANQPVDPIQSRKENPAEIYRDPRAEALLDIKAFPEIKFPGLRVLAPAEVEGFRRMAGDNLGGSPDVDLIRRVVENQVVQLTNHNNIQAVINPPPNLPPNSATARAIQNASSLLLEAIFSARSAKNTRFRDEYNKILLQKLPPLLKNHLIPRIQAMLILGQSGNPNALSTFLNEIKDEKQTALVKLWALKGISNIRQFGGRVMPADVEVSTARTVADLLASDPDLPWPVQLRALEVLAELRQGHSAATPRKLEIASVAMQYLANPKLKPEVRAEAAKALGAMQISSVLTDYDYYAIAHQAGTVAAELGDLIGKQMGDNPNRAEYYGVYLIGPILLAFEGTSGSREAGGLLRNSTSPSQAKIQEIHNLIRPMAKTSVELVRSGRGQIPGKQKELAAEVTSLKDYLQKNPPKSLRLIPDEQ